MSPCDPIMWLTAPSPISAVRANTPIFAFTILLSLAFQKL